MRHFCIHDNPISPQSEGAGFTPSFWAPVNFVVHVHACAPNAGQLKRHCELVAMAAHAQEFGFHSHDGKPPAARHQLMFRETDVSQKIFLHLMQQVKKLRIKNNARWVAMLKADPLVGHELQGRRCLHGVQGA